MNINIMGGKIVKFEFDKKETIGGVMTLVGFVTISACITGIRKCYKRKRKEVREKEDIENLIQQTRGLQEELNNDKVRDYIKIIKDMEMPNHIAAFVTAKDGYNIIKDSEIVDAQLKKDLKLLLEIKGVKDYLKY